VEKRSSGLDVREAVSFATQRRFDYVEAKAVRLCRSKGGGHPLLHYVDGVPALYKVVPRAVRCRLQLLRRCKGTRQSRSCAEDFVPAVRENKNKNMFPNNKQTAFLFYHFLFFFLFLPKHIFFYLVRLCICIHPPLHLHRSAGTSSRRRTLQSKPPGQSPGGVPADDVVKALHRRADDYVVHPSAWTKSFASIHVVEERVQRRRSGSAPPGQSPPPFFDKKDVRVAVSSASTLSSAWTSASPLLRFSTLPLLHFTASRTDGRMDGWGPPPQRGRHLRPST
jgi:hypothetical protein